MKFKIFNLDMDWIWYPAHLIWPHFPVYSLDILSHSTVENGGNCAQDKRYKNRELQIMKDLRCKAQVDFTVYTVYTVMKPALNTFHNWGHPISKHFTTI